MKPDVLPSLFILLLSLTPWLVNGKSPPGKPIIISCQSSGNETFTCRWKPGSNGGLPTNHTLLYKTAGEERTYECPDYVSAGPNSCYFDKKLLGRSASYNITVKATNDLGSSISDPHYVDASSAGKPDPPSDLSLEAKHLDGITYVWAKWSLPPLAPGAVNSQKLNHELRLKSAGDEEWEVHFVGEKTQYQIFPLHLGVKYVVQVRRITDYGEKSKWSPEAYIQLPSGQPPGKPEVVRCRSPEKETFTCWWKPGSDGGLPTNYTLFYNMEKEKSYHECPDYITGGPNSCYFDKKHTSIWTIYNVTVKATNALGSNTSEPHYVDVAFIVETNPPVNLTLEWMDQANGKYLLLNWAPPPLADVRSGWLTLEYELRIKQEGHDWEEIFVGVGTKYQLFSLNSGVKYIVQVRCRSHGGRWSQWSSESDIQLPKVFRLKDIIVWIFVAFLSFIICSIMIWTMALKGFSMVACILPPVPGPKIPGFDVHLLKAGKADEIISALGCPVFPLTSDSSDEMEKWLVIDSEEQQLMPSNENTIQYNTNAELIHKETDGDSGRGSSESPSLLLEKSKEAGNPPLELKTPDPNELQGNIARKCNGKTPGMDLEGQHPFLSTSNPKVSTWPGSQVANSQFPRCSYHDIVDACKIALSAMNINGLSMLTGNKDQCNSECPKTIGEVKTTKLQETEKVPLNIQSDLGSPWSMPTEWLPILPAKAMDYVEVHKVNHDGALAVVPKQKQNLDKTERASVPGDLKEYTKVSTVVASHILVLMPDPKVETSPCCQEPPKKPNWCCQPNLAEKNMSYCHPAPTACKIQTGGLDYIDPNNFMCSFN